MTTKEILIQNNQLTFFDKNFRSYLVKNLIFSFKSYNNFHFPLKNCFNSKNRIKKEIKRLNILNIKSADYKEINVELDDNIIRVVIKTAYTTNHPIVIERKNEEGSKFH